MPSLIPGIAAVVEKDPHKLGNCEGRVCIVDMDSNLFVEVVKGTVNAHMLVYDVADRRSAEEILLSESEGFTLGVVIVRIEHLCDSL